MTNLVHKISEDIFYVLDPNKPDQTKPGPNNGRGPGPKPKTGTKRKPKPDPKKTGPKPKGTLTYL